MSAALDRGLALIEQLIGQPEGATLSALKDDLVMPSGACHRLLQLLVQRGYVRQLRPQGPYVLTAKIASLGLAYLSSTGIVDIAEPLLERLAHDSGELVRLSIVDDDRLTWVAKAQGTRKGVRYDPDMGMDASLSCTASGHAWLLTLSDERALELVSRQGFGAPKHYGPKAPTTLKARHRLSSPRRQAAHCLVGFGDQGVRGAEGATQRRRRRGQDRPGLGDRESTPQERWDSREKANPGDHVVEGARQSVSAHHDRRLIENEFDRLDLVQLGQVSAQLFQVGRDRMRIVPAELQGARMRFRNLRPPDRPAGFRRQV